MFKCKRTNEVVSVSVVQGYTFYNASLDEDLFLHEVYLAVSDTAKAEAKDIDIAKLPYNFSHNRELVQAVQQGSLSDVLHSIDNNTRPLEYCEAVLVQAFISK